MEKVQYSLIYLFFKTKYFNASRSYLYRANQALAMSLSINIFFLSLLITNLELSNTMAAGIFFVTAAGLFYAFEKNTTKHKLYKYRIIYPRHKKYLTMFFILIFSTSIILLAAIEYKKNYTPNKNQKPPTQPEWAIYEI